MNKMLRLNLFPSCELFLTTFVADFQDEDLQKTVEESEKLYSTYSQYFDKVITNENMDTALKELKHCIEELSTEPQWVPVSWVY